jgi:predicted N-acetyltransferase YhbS
MDAAVCRPARPEEMEEVYRMGYDAWADGDGVDAYLASCAASPKYARGRWLVLEEGGTLLSSLIVYDLGGPAAGLGSIATAPERRGRGYASALVGAAAGAIEGAGKRRVFLFSDIGPEFYERLGFRVLPPRFQFKPGSSCMVRADDFDGLLSEPGFAPPEYF